MVALIESYIDIVIEIEEETVNALRDIPRTSP